MLELLIYNLSNYMLHRALPLSESLRLDPLVLRRPQNSMISLSISIDIENLTNLEQNPIVSGGYAVGGLPEHLDRDLEVDKTSDEILPTTHLMLLSPDTVR